MEQYETTCEKWFEFFDFRDQKLVMQKPFKRHKAELILRRLFPA